MTLSLLDAANQSIEPDLRHRVNVATYMMAITALNAAAPSLPTTQPQRNALIAAVVQNYSYAESTFVGFVVTDPSLTTVSDLAGAAGDTKILNRITLGVFDAAAHVLFPSL
jgi:hypothetical protein